MVKFVGLSYAIVILVDPQQEFRIHRIPRIDHAISIAAILRQIEYGQRQMAIGVIGFWLRSVITKQILTASDAVASIQSQKGVVRACGSPVKLDLDAVSCDIEMDAIFFGRELKSLASGVDDDWT